jgi:hypothetical protein
MGVTVAAAKCRNRDPARPALHAVGQSDPRAERGGAAYVAYVLRWGVQLAAHLSESKAWAIYRERLKRFASLISDREPIVLYKQIPGMGRAKRYIITIADDNRGPLDKLCEKLIAGGVTCDVLRNTFGQDR